MLRAAHRDAEADDSIRPFAHRLLAAAQSRAVYFQEVVKSAHAPESSVPVVPTAERANAAINVARRLEDEILLVWTSDTLTDSSAIMLFMHLMLVKPKWIEKTRLAL